MNYEIGDLVRYELWGGGTRVGVVTSKEDDIKNGRPGFGIRTADGGRFWGYDDQIIGVDRRDDLGEQL